MIFTRCLTLQVQVRILFTFRFKVRRVDSLQKCGESLRNLKVERTELVFKLPLIAHDSELDELRSLMEKVRDAGFSIACSDLGAAQLAEDLAVAFTAQKSSIFSTLLQPVLSIRRSVQSNPFKRIEPE